MTGLERLTLEQSFILFRHGLRSPLEGEAATSAFAVAPIPAWSGAPGALTERGAEAAERMGRFLRLSYASQGLLPEAGCPPPDAVAITSNSVQRTIATARAMAAGLAPGCRLVLQHRPEGQRDPIFSPIEALGTGFDAATTARAIIASVGGLDHLVVQDAAEFQLMQRVLGCTTTKPPCDLARLPSGLTADAGGHSLVLSGPIEITSGTAEVFLLQYMQGLPLAQVGWGRADAGALARMSVLHALLFDVLARPRPVSALISAPLRARLSRALSQPAKRKLILLVGHDDNIAGLASWLGIAFKVPGYGANDPPIGGGLGFEVWRTATGERIVRTIYISQTPDQIRNLARLSLSEPAFEVALPLPACADGPEHTCPIGKFLKLLATGR